MKGPSRAIACTDHAPDVSQLVDRPPDLMSDSASDRGDRQDTAADPLWRRPIGDLDAARRRRTVRGGRSVRAQVSRNGRPGGTLDRSSRRCLAGDARRVVVGEPSRLRRQQRDGEPASDAALADAVLEQLQTQAAGRPVLVTGSSLGCVSALYLAARHPFAGLILRNPPPLREVILARFGWWPLESGRPAARAAGPAGIGRDPQCGRRPRPGRLRHGPAGPRRPAEMSAANRGRLRRPPSVLHLAQADHHTPLTDEETEQYRELLVWLRQQMMSSRVRMPGLVRVQVFRFETEPLSPLLQVSSSKARTHRAASRWRSKRSRLISRQRRTLTTSDFARSACRSATPT